MSAIVNRTMSMTIGQYGRGNIDLYNRPLVRTDGGTATVRSMSFEDETGRQVLIPTISNNGQIMSANESIANYYNTGQYLGKFNTINQANTYANRLHLQQQRYYKGLLEF